MGHPTATYERQMQLSSKFSLSLPLTLDLTERLVHATFFSFLTWTLLRSWFETGSVTSLILLASEGSVIAFMLFRRFTLDVSVRPADWLFAVVGTTLPLIVQPTEGDGLASPLFCLTLMVFGFGIQIAAKFTLRRSFGVAPANRGVKIGGPYRFVRHPMYAGYLVTQVGFLLSHPSVWNLSIYATTFAFQIGRIMAEERLLSRDSSYRQFATLVPSRLVPGIF